ncbi:Nucleotidyltransferase domain-containing protein [Seinonella peptonophila]|uniref:Nucleotidyltransferase domain-containing protein n=1 Tax=Seinonella peptonophila TaxID=112248 RepID=A0A1M5AWA9_9BACL|nr:nucleotidyltransferase domain-containing protein [Seinonella peptonophila]SHF34534.1 Nucleotidyltransferase domain-containing protein [Seinonella peptonophila]
MIEGEVKEVVKQYFERNLMNQSAYKYLGSQIEKALLLVVGSYSSGMAHSQSDLDIEMIVSDEAYKEMLLISGSPKALWVHDEEYSILVDIKVRSYSWLEKKLNGDPEFLWVYEQAICIQDPGLFKSWIDESRKLFKEKLDQYIFNSYKDLKIGVTLDDQKDLLGRYLIKAKTIEAALVIPLLLNELPYPYPKWQTWWLMKHVDIGEKIVGMCELFTTRDQTYRTILHLINDLLVQKGHGELTKDFWRKL